MGHMQMVEQPKISDLDVLVEFTDDAIDLSSGCHTLISTL